MDYLSTDKVLVIDLAASTVTETSLDEALVSEKIGGAGITRHLYDQYQGDDPVVIGTGLLTGTTCPASAAGVITAKSPVTGKICHCPVNYKVGIEIKFSGYDYIVVKGTAAKPVYLWIHDGVADIADASEIWGKNVWEATDFLRHLVGDELLQTMLIGKAGENGSNYAQVCYNHWNSPDRFGFGKLFGTKNLKGLAFRGMGLIEVADAEGFVKRSHDLLKEIKANNLMQKKGIGEIAVALGDSDLPQWMAPVVHRHSADYFTPYPTNTAVFLDDDPKRVEESKVAEPGMLIADVYALMAFRKLGLTAEDAGRAMRECAKYGIDPLAVAELSGKTSLKDMIASFDSLNGAIPLYGNGCFSPWTPNRPIFNDFGVSGDDVTAWWERRMAIALIFGIQPVFAVMCPELTEESLVELSGIGTELEITQETLDQVVSGLCG
jgi:aldehyde:ferredoxin oxidoreductase